MNALEKLIEKLMQLAQEQRWQEMISMDEEVRRILVETGHNLTSAQKANRKTCLLKLQEIYTAAAGKLEGSRGESAQQMRQIQRGFRAAKSYLDHAKP